MWLSRKRKDSTIIVGEEESQVSDPPIVDSREGERYAKHYIRRYVNPPLNDSVVSSEDSYEIDHTTPLPT